MDLKINKVMFGGGGAKGIAYIGVIKFLEDNTEYFDIKEIVGVSIGSVFGLFYAIGYTSDELQHAFTKLKVGQLKKISIKKLFTDYGLDDCSRIMNWISDMVIAKGIDKDITFKQLRERNDKVLRIFSKNLNTYEDTIFDETFYGEMKILDAVRMSIGIPLLFTAVKYKGDIYIDGGIAKSYPIEIHDFYSKNNDFLGFKLSKGTTKQYDNNEIITFNSYVVNLMKCFLKTKSERLNNTVYIDTSGITEAVNFNLKKKDINKLILVGYNSILNYFYEEKKRRFRKQ